MRQERYNVWQKIQNVKDKLEKESGKYAKFVNCMRQYHNHELTHSQVIEEVGRTVVFVGGIADTHLNPVQVSKLFDDHPILVQQFTSKWLILPFVC